MAVETEDVFVDRVASVPAIRFSETNATLLQDNGGIRNDCKYRRCTELALLEFAMNNAREYNKGIDQRA